MKAVKLLVIFSILLLATVSLAQVSVFTEIKEMVMKYSTPDKDGDCFLYVKEIDDSGGGATTYVIGYLPGLQIIGATIIINRQKFTVIYDGEKNRYYKGYSYNLDLLENKEIGVEEAEKLASYVMKKFRPKTK